MALSTARRALTILGVVYVLFGILGFVPGITVPGGPTGQGLLLGIFAVNAVHNIAHLALGAAMIYGGMSDSAFRATARTLAIVFVVLAIGSFIAPLVEGVNLNLPDSGLHIGTALLLGYLAWGTRTAADRTPTMA